MLEASRAGFPLRVNLIAVPLKSGRAAATGSKGDDIAIPIRRHPAMRRAHRCRQLVHKGSEEPDTSLGPLSESCLQAPRPGKKTRVRKVLRPGGLFTPSGSWSVFQGGGEGGCTSATRLKVEMQEKARSRPQPHLHQFGLLPSR